jgi:hypothetical protein
VVDLNSSEPRLTPTGWWSTSALAAEVLKSTLAGFNYRNLDEEPAFTGRNTTTEFLAHEIFERVVAAIGRGELGAAARGVESLRVTLHESHVASASFAGPIA